LGHGKLRCLFRYAMDYMDLLLKSPDVTLATLTKLHLSHCSNFQSQLSQVWRGKINLIQEV